MSKASQAHPKYADMIVAALKALGGKEASRQAINNYIVKEYNLTKGNHHNTMLRSNLKRASAPEGPIVHSKGKGAAGSFKLRVVQESKAKPSSAKKTAPKPAAKKQQVKKAVAKKSKAPKGKKKAEERKSESPKAASKPAKTIKAKAGKKSMSASPKKPKAVKAKKSPKKVAQKLPKKK